jgi:hypothetical protein
VIEGVRRELCFGVLSLSFGESGVRKRDTFGELGSRRLGRLLCGSSFFWVAGYGRPALFLGLGCSGGRHGFAGFMGRDMS